MTRSERRSLTPQLTMWRTSSRRAGALITFSQGFFLHLILQQGIGHQPLEPVILVFKLTEALGIGDSHATEHVAPVVVAGRRETVTAT